jgi:hypothetical protein
MNLKIGEVFTSKFVGTGPSSYKKRIYRAAVSQRLRNTVLDDPHKKVVSLSILRAGGFYPLPGNIPGNHFCYRLNRLQDHRFIMLIKNYNDTIENRTRDLSACNARYVQ